MVNFQKREWRLSSLNSSSLGTARGAQRNKLKTGIWFLSCSWVHQSVYWMDYGSSPEEMTCNISRANVEYDYQLLLQGLVCKGAGGA